jgi:type II secretory pathway predicted ATPase ExeA
MFQAFYSMDFNPFSKEVDIKHHFKSNDFIQAANRLEYLKQVKGIALVAGEPGSGKTFSLKCFVSSLNRNLYKTVYIPLTTITVKEFYMILCDGLGVIPTYKKVELFKQIQESIMTYAGKNITPVIIIDEVQFISNAILDDLRLILNFDMDTKNPCIVILSGQPKLVLQLNRQTHEALRQRIIVNYTFSGLSKDETKEYILSRLKACGVSEPIFEENAYEFIYSSTGGYARKINNLVTMGLICGAREKVRTLNSELMLRALNEMSITAS